MCKKEVNYNDGGSLFLEYNKTGQLIQASEDIGVSYFEYDPEGRLTKHIDHRGNQIDYTWTPEGKKASITYPNGAAVRYSYDEAGNLTRVQDINDQLTEYSYDEINRLTEEILPNQITTSYQYDTVGNLTNMLQTNTDGELIDEYSYTYDNARNVLSKSQYGEYTRNYTYDELNRLTAVEVGDETIQYVYDSVGNRRQQYQQAVDEITNLINYEYDAANKLLSFDNEKYKYDDNGNLIEIKRGNKAENLYEYDDQNRQVSSENKWGDTSTYTYDFMGNRVTVETSINTNGGGNRPDPDKDKVKTNNGKGIGVGQIPPGHQKRDIDLVNENIDGENTNKAGWGHQYNRTDTRTEYVYDITSRYQDVLMEYGQHSQTQLYTYGVGRIAVDFNELDDANNGWIPKAAPTVLEPAMERLYYIKDELGTTKRLIGEDGKASVSYRYYDFGSPDTTTHFDINWSGPDNLFGYTGYEWDKVAEMWYAKARYYNSDLGRFPVKGNQLDIQTLNLYPYVANNPLKYIDPNGRATTPKWLGYAWRRGIEDAQKMLDDILSQYRYGYAEGTLFNYTPVPMYEERLNLTVDQRGFVNSEFEFADIVASIASGYGEAKMFVYTWQKIATTAVYTYVDQGNPMPGIGDIPEIVGLDQHLIDNIAEAAEKYDYIENSAYRYLVSNGSHLFENARELFIKEIEKDISKISAKNNFGFSTESENSSYKNGVISYLNYIINLNENYDRSFSYMAEDMKRISNKY